MKGQRVSVCVRVCARARVCVCVCVRERERGKSAGATRRPAAGCGLLGGLCRTSPAP